MAKKARFRWFVLNLPFGTTSGFVGVTLGYVAKQAGMSDSTIAGLIAMNLLPHTWKFLWGPIADLTLTRKKWYVLANGVSCATILAMAFIPFARENLTAFKALIFFNSLAITFLGMAVEGLMAHTTPEEHRGTAAGWFQAGNLGGYGLGGGLALYIAENVAIRPAFITTACVLAACTIALRLVPNVEGADPIPRAQVAGRAARVEAIRIAIIDLAKDLAKTFATRRGAMALVICFMPLGAGAAVGMFSAMANRWSTPGDVVAITMGLIGGMIAVPGCLTGGWLSDRMNRRLAYVLSGVLLAVVAAGMALAPRNMYTFVTFTLTYQFVAGMVYGCFTGFVLETIGTGAVATKYNALASLSNIPIWYMTLLLGWVSDQHGAVAMLLFEASAGMVGLLVLIAAYRALRAPVAPPRPPRDDGDTRVDLS